MIRMTPRYFILPILALIVIGSLPAPADSGRTAGISGSCGPALSTIADPSLKSSFDNLERTQSGRRREDLLDLPQQHKCRSLGFRFGKPVTSDDVSYEHQNAA